MPRQNVPFLSFNRGLLSPKALARVDIDRTRLSAEAHTNWISATQGSMSLRPGTKYFGSSRNDTGAEFLEFVASTDDVALVELTGDTMRLWIGDDAHELELLSRPGVDTTVSFSDTGWSNASTGGSFSAESSADIIPAMTAATTSGVTITNSSARGSDGFQGWKVGDNNITTAWHDTGPGNNSLPSWLNVDFGASNTKAISGYSIRVSDLSGNLDNAPTTWRLITSNFDTGTYASDTGKWTLQDSRSSETGWAVSEKRTYTTPEGDTGTVTARRHWRLFFTAVNGDTELVINEIEMFVTTSAATNQVLFQNGALVLDAISVGAVAKATKRVIVSDTGTEHSLAITVERGPVTLRVGSTNGDDDYISEASLGAGHHNLAFTPEGNFWITLQNEQNVDRIVSSIAVSDSGIVEVDTPWGASNLADVRYDQSADVVYVDCFGVQPQKIERRGTGRSWSAVEYAPTNGPFLVGRSSSAKLAPSHFYGNTTMESDIPFFSPFHVGALFRLTQSGQSGEWALGAKNAVTDAVQVTGVNDTGNYTADNERRVVFTVSGTWAGQITIERSFDGPDFGFKKASLQRVAVVAGAGLLADTGTFTTTIDDLEDNLQVWYRAKVTSYTSGVPIVRITYRGGSTTGIARVTDYNDNQSVDIEVIRRFSDTGYTEDWQEGYWSDNRGYPESVSLHGGRLAHANGANLFLTVADDFENFDQDTEGDAGPIIRTLGSGPVDSIHYLVSLLRLIVGTAGAEISVRSSSLDEPLTPDNCSASAFSTQGSANLRAVKMDTRAIMVQRSLQRVFMIGPAENSLADYEAFDLTLLVPDLLEAGAVSVAIQRQPDTRVHCVLADGTVAILTYEPQEEVICWTKWETDGFVEKAAVLPGVGEDAVYYHIRRTISAIGNDSFTKILLHFDGSEGSTDVTDSNAGGSAHTWTAAGSASLDTDKRRFGSASLLNGYVSTPDHADFTLGSGDFTIDCWFNCDATSGTTQRLCGHRVDTTAANTSFRIERAADNTITAGVGIGSSITSANSTSTFTSTVNTGLHHLAFVRDGSTLRLFIDGVQEATAAVSGTVNDVSASFGVGSQGDVVTNPWTGWIDEFRLSVGIARWTSAFTPPAHPYGAPGSTLTKRFLEKWAMASECEGDTGLTWLADCAVSFSDTGRDTTFAGAAVHLPGRQVIAWGDLDTGSTPYVDLSPDVAGVQTTHQVDTGTGDVTFSGLTQGVHQGVLGLPYRAKWRSTKLAYAAQFGTALAQYKRVDKIGLILHQTHNNGLFIGSDSGHLDPLPRVVEGAVVDQDHIFPTLDAFPNPFNGVWDTDSRFEIHAVAPRPATVLACVPTIDTEEKY